MRINKLNIFLFLLAGATVYVSCRKMDQRHAEPAGQNPETRFFALHSSNKPLIQSISQYFKHLNEKDHFVEKTIQRIGYPRWDKAVTVKSPAVFHRGASDSVELTYIPFVRETEDFVNASLLVQTSATDTLYKYICDWQYQYVKKGVFEDTAITAERIALTLITLDKEVFGHTKYDLTDNALFSHYLPDSLRGQQTYLEIGTQNTGRNEAMGAPIPVYVSCPLCVFTYWQIIFYYNLNSIQNWGLPEGGGGGGGSGGSTPPECPSVTGKNNIAQPCQPGWVPDPGGGTIPQNNPCDTLNKYSQGNDFRTMFQLLKAEVPSRKENMYIFHNTLLPGAPGNEIHSVTGHDNEFFVYPPDEALFQGCWGWIHNHFADEDSAGLIFSAGDLNILVEQVLRDSAFFHADYKRFMIGVVGDSNTQYILMVDDITQLTTWASMIYTNEAAIEAAFAGAELSQKYLPLSVAESEKRFLKVIKNSGLKLFRGSNDFTTWTPIALNHAGTAIYTAVCP